MTANRRIFVNVMTTYGRSVLGLFCALLSNRWILAALGVEAFGVYGVVGVVIGICTTINATVSGSVGRFYAHAFGELEIAIDKKRGIQECTDWFNTALALHILSALIFFGVGFFAGRWAIANYFNIPVAYAETADLILVIALLSMVFGMISAPFKAMYIAQQLIMELTLYDVLTPMLILLLSVFLLRYSGNRLLFYAFSMAVIAALPNVIIVTRALLKFPSCKILFSRMFVKDRWRRLSVFVGWQFVGLLGYTFRMQGVPIVVNRCLGVAFNSTMSMTNTVVNGLGALSGALNNAFSPAITNAAGAKDVGRFFALSIRSCKFGAVLLALFALPFMLEMEYVVRLWLTVVPPEMCEMCVIMIVVAIVERMAQGAVIAINAEGDVAIHENLCFVLHVFTIALAIILTCVFDMGIKGVGYAILIGTVLISCMRMFVWKLQLHFPIRPWLIGFMFPFFCVTLGALLLGWIVKGLMQESLSRFLSVGLIVAMSFSIGVLLLVLSREERAFLRKKFRSMYERKKR